MAVGTRQQVILDEQLQFVALGRARLRFPGGDRCGKRRGDGKCIEQPGVGKEFHAGDALPTGRSFPASQPAQRPKARGTAAGKAGRE